MAKKRVGNKSKFSRGKYSGSYILVVIMLLMLICIALYYTTHNSGGSSSKSEILLEMHNTIPSKSDHQPHNEVEKKKKKKTEESLKRVVAIDGAEIPFISDSTYLINNTIGRYTFLYNPKHKQAEWVAYLLTRKEVTRKGTDRGDSFKKDPRVETKGWNSAELLDYRGSGYDRGHLIPSADRDDMSEENDETFLLSNISPQQPNLNRETWRLLEEKIRRWANRYDSLYIVTGGILSTFDNKPFKTIGEGLITVPNHYYKVIMSFAGGECRTIGFIIPNRNDTDRDFMKYVVTVDSIEKATSINFYHLLDDSIENTSESIIDKRFWK